MKSQFDFSGVDVHVDTNIGKHLSSLGHTLTTLTGEYEEEGTTTAEDGSSASDDLDDLDLSSSDDLNVLKRQKVRLDSYCNSASVQSRRLHLETHF